MVDYEQLLLFFLILVSSLSNQQIVNIGYILLMLTCLLNLCGKPQLNSRLVPCLHTFSVENA